MDNNRLLAFARKPAPVQIAYLAYCGSSGMSAMDYRLTDPYLDPPGGDESVYSEKSLRLPETFWCYRPTGDEPAVGPLPALGARHITFGCLNSFAKVTPPTLQAWARLLGEVSGSRLLIHYPSLGGCPPIEQEFGQAGIAMDRLTVVPFLDSSQYFATYNRIDIALDPFPFGGGTTTCDALWMGVPVVSLAGSTGVSRSGLSLLSNIGLPELVGTTVEQYRKVACALAGDLTRLAELRATMRSRMEASPLMDAQRFVRNLEQVFRASWAEWCTRES